MKRLLLLAPILLLVACDPSPPAPPPPTVDLGTTQAEDMAPAMVCASRISCTTDQECPASIWGKCEAGCCVCRPPAGAMCPVAVRGDLTEATRR